MARRAAPRLGLIVNPVAGIGGRLALKGSDDAKAVGHALAAGVAPVSGPRALRALALVARAVPDLQVLAPAGEMGGELAARAGIAADPLAHRPSRPTTAADTAAAAAELAARDVELVLFAGGDGTARDVADAVSGRVPISVAQVAATRTELPTGG